jgi:glutaredoxin-dependent peroxiredoxin
MPLQVGAKAPDFSLFDTDKKQHTLSEFSGKKLVLLFYPGAFTGVCTKEMCSFRDSLSEYNKLGAQVVAISVDSPFANKGFKDQNNLAFPLLSDYTKSVSQQYTGLYSDFAGLPGLTAAKRAAFVLDGKGVVKYAWISDSPGNEPPYDEVKKAALSA